VLQLAARPDYTEKLPACKLLYITARQSAAERLKLLLSRYSQVELQSVTDVMKGIFAARTSAPDMLLFDSDISGMSMADFVAVLGADPLTKNIPQLVFGERNVPEGVVQLPPDYDLGALAECLHTALTRAQGSLREGK